MEYKDYWDSVAGENKLYQMGPSLHRVYLLDLLAAKKVHSLLDVGCGTAPIYDLIINSEEDRWDNITKYKGVDPAEAMIQSCKYNFPYGDFEVQNATDLREEDESWDCVLMMHSLDYVYDYAKALEEAARVAKKYILIVFWRELNYNQGAENKLNDSDAHEEGYDWKNARLQEFSWDELNKVFISLGLEVAERVRDSKINTPGKQNTLILLKK